MTNST